MACEQRKLVDRQFRQAVRRAQRSGLKQMEQHAFAEDPLQRLTYHNRSHAQEFIRRGLSILDAIGKAAPELATDRDKELLRLTGAFHDVIQDQTLGGHPLKRHVRRIHNEEASAKEAISHMQGKVFTNRDREIVEEAILVTIPQWDAVHSTVVQKHLPNRTSMVTVAAALADINGSGLRGPRIFQQESDRLFIEDNPDITERLSQSPPPTPEELQSFKDRELDYLTAQVAFVRGRQVLVPEELQAIPNEAARRSVRALFTHFDKSAAHIERLREQRAKQSPTQVLKSVGFEKVIRRR